MNADFNESFYYCSLLVILRMVRLVRITRIFWQRRHIQTGARQFISQNKRRFQQEGFDLDLTYVNNRIIAMSFPSAGKWSLYRNDIKVREEKNTSIFYIRLYFFNRKFRGFLTRNTKVDTRFTTCVPRRRTTYRILTTMSSGSASMIIMCLESSTENVIFLFFA